MLLAAWRQSNALRKTLSASIGYFVQYSHFNPFLLFTSPRLVQTDTDCIFCLFMMTWMGRDRSGNRIEWRSLTSFSLEQQLLQQSSWASGWQLSRLAPANILDEMHTVFRLLKERVRGRTSLMRDLDHRSRAASTLSFRFIGMYQRLLHPSIHSKFS